MYINYQFLAWHNLAISVHRKESCLDIESNNRSKLNLVRNALVRHPSNNNNLSKERAKAITVTV